MGVVCFGGEGTFFTTFYPIASILTNQRNFKNLLLITLKQCKVDTLPQPKGTMGNPHWWRWGVSGSLGVDSYHGTLGTAGWAEVPAGSPSCVLAFERGCRGHSLRCTPEVDCGWLSSLWVLVAVSMTQIGNTAIESKVHLPVGTNICLASLLQFFIQVSISWGTFYCLVGFLENVTLKILKGRK